MAEYSSVLQDASVAARGTVIDWARDGGFKSELPRAFSVLLGKHFDWALQQGTPSLTLHVASPLHVSLRVSSSILLLQKIQQAHALNRSLVPGSVQVDASTIAVFVRSDSGFIILRVMYPTNHRGLA